MRIAIIGAGKMGRWFTNFFKNENYSVVISSRTRSKAMKIGIEFGVEVAQKNLDAIRGADWIVLCVSLDGLEPVLKEIGSQVSSNQVLMDICSIKEIPVNLLHKYVENGIVLGTHPVFGPGARNLRGQNFVLTPVDDTEKFFAIKFTKWLEKRGAKVSILSPKRHDELMSLVLGFPHFVGLVASETVLENENFIEAKNIGGATYKLLLTLAGAVSSEEPNFYSNLHMSLPEVEQIESLFLKKLKEWLELVKNKDCIGFSDRMRLIKNSFKELDLDYDRYYKLMYKLLDND